MSSGHDSTKRKFLPFLRVSLSRMPSEHPLTDRPGRDSPMESGSCASLMERSESAAGFKDLLRERNDFTDPSPKGQGPVTGGWYLKYCPKGTDRALRSSNSKQLFHNTPPHSRSRKGRLFAVRCQKERAELSDGTGSSVRYRIQTALEYQIWGQVRKGR